MIKNVVHLASTKLISNQKDVKTNHKGWWTHENTQHYRSEIGVVENGSATLEARNDGNRGVGKQYSAESIYWRRMRVSVSICLLPLVLV